MIDLSCIHENVGYSGDEEIFACRKCGAELTPYEAYLAWQALQGAS